MSDFNVNSENVSEKNLASIAQIDHLISAVVDIRDDTSVPILVTTNKLTGNLESINGDPAVLKAIYYNSKIKYYFEDNRIICDNDVPGVVVSNDNCEYKLFFTRLNSSFNRVNSSFTRLNDEYVFKMHHSTTECLTEMYYNSIGHNVNYLDGNKICPRYFRDDGQIICKYYGTSDDFTYKTSFENKITKNYLEVDKNLLTGIFNGKSFTLNLTDFKKYRFCGPRICISKNCEIFHKLIRDPKEYIVPEKDGFPFH